MGVDLGDVLDAGGGQAEGADGPLQVVRLLGGAQRQQLTQGGLVDLDDLRATWSAVSPGGWSSRTKAQASMVTGPVSMPLTILSVKDCAVLNHSTVMAFGRVTSPNRIGGRTQREP